MKEEYSRLQRQRRESCTNFINIFLSCFWESTSRGTCRSGWEKMAIRKKYRNRNELIKRFLFEHYYLCWRRREEETLQTFDKFPSNPRAIVVAMQVKRQTKFDTEHKLARDMKVSWGASGTMQSKLNELFHEKKVKLKLEILRNLLHAGELSSMIRQTFSKIFDCSMSRVVW